MHPDDLPIPAAGEIALDVETTGTGSTARIRTLQLGWAGTSAVLVLADSAMRTFAGELLAGLDGRLWAYTNFDRRMIAADLGLKLGVRDAAALHHRVNQSQATGRDPLKSAISEITGDAAGMTGAATLDHHVLCPKFLAYAGRDASGLSLVLDRWLSTQDRTVLDPWLDREQQIADLCHDMQSRGIPVDLGELESLRSRLEAEVAELAEPVERICPGLNPNSHQQLVAAYEARGISLPEKRRKRKDGTVHYSKATGHKDLHSDDPLVVAVHALKKQRAAATTMASWRDLLGEDGRIHARFNPLGARTSRWSSSNPNLQNVSKHDGDLRMRAPFVAPEGFAMVQADLSQIEYRVAAALSEDPAMLAAFAAGKDLHVYAAQVLNGVEHPTKEQRSAAKSVGFGKLYGQTPRTAARDAGISVEEMEARVQAYDQAFPRLAAWAIEVGQYAQRNGLHTPASPYGRSFKVPADYVAVNYLVQSTAREVFCDWMLNLDSAGLSQYLVAGVHDEWLLLVPEQDAQRVLDATLAAAAAVQIPGHPDVAIAADGVVAGRSWADAYGKD